MDIIGVNNDNENANSRRVGIIGVRTNNPPASAIRPTEVIINAGPNANIPKIPWRVIEFISRTNPSATAVIIGGSAWNTPIIIFPNASIKGVSRDNENANGIIATPNAAKSPIPINTNNAVAGFPNAARPPANATKFAEIRAPIPGIDINVKNGIPTSINARAGAKSNNVTAPIIPFDRDFKPWPKPCRLLLSIFKGTIPINDKNGIAAILNTAAGANKARAAIPLNVPFPIALKPAAKSWKNDLIFLLFTPANPLALLSVPFGIGSFDIGGVFGAILLALKRISGLPPLVSGLGVAKFFIAPPILFAKAFASFKPLLIFDENLPIPAAILGR